MWNFLKWKFRLTSKKWNCLSRWAQHGWSKALWIISYTTVLVSGLSTCSLHFQPFDAGHHGAHYSPNRENLVQQNTRAKGWIDTIAHGNGHTDYSGVIRMSPAFFFLTVETDRMIESMLRNIFSHGRNRPDRTSKLIRKSHNCQTETTTHSAEKACNDEQKHKLGCIQFDKLTTLLT